MRKNWLNGLFHPAVVWDESYDGNSDFCGIMLTHREPNGQFDNIPMAVNHFENEHEIVFSNSHFVNQLFVKFQSWGAFELVGRLTEEGIEFIENNLNTNSFPMEFIQYKQLVTG
ncbi:MAG TPA: hypothetical protein DIU20_05275 [Cryomorphaceae bacterium]|nr:hypothetical protein [Owenweeksia sp.]HCQ15650.1 hypothetical protein [Cryomorphaceae bacterium]